MKKNYDKFCSSGWVFLLPFVIYVIGFIVSPPNDVETLKNKGIAQQEEYLYNDSEGEEHQDQTLIYIEGIGKVLTYRDVYLKVIPFFLVSIFFTHIIFKEKGELSHLLYTYCIIGTILLYFISRKTILSIALYWMAIIALRFAIYKSENTNNTSG